MSEFQSFAVVWFSWFLSALWQLTLLALAVWAVGRLLRRAPAQVRYLAWLLVLAKAFLPSSLSAPWGVGSLIGAPLRSQLLAMIRLFEDPMQTTRLAPMLREDIGLRATNALTSQIGLADQAAVYTISLFFGLYLFGVLLSLLSVFIQQRRLSRQLLMARSVDSGPLFRLYSDCAAELGVRNAPQLLLCQSAGSPFLGGLIRPVIVLPAGLPAELTPEDMRRVFAHELIHYRRGDLAVCWLQALAQALLWFHPVVWIVNAELDRQREYAVDETVIREFDGRRAAYGRTLLDVLEHGALRTVATLAFTGAQDYEEARRRIVHIMTHRTATQREMLTMQCSVVIAAAVLLPMSPPAGEQPEEPDRAVSVLVKEARHDPRA